MTERLPCPACEQMEVFDGEHYDTRSMAYSCKTLKAVREKAGVNARRHFSGPHVSVLASGAAAAADVYEPVVREMAEAIVMIHGWHGKPFYGKRHQCDACAMGHPCPIRDLLNRARELLA